MSDAERERPPFYQLNWLGKAAVLGGTALRLSANFIDAAFERTRAIAEESRDAFNRELDPNIEDAHILEEHVETVEEQREM